MRVPDPSNDGMGSLLDPASGCRFRVWAPNASRVQVVLNNIANPPAFDLGPEPGTGNWSADQAPGIVVGTKYQYVITNIGGPNNDNSQLWYRMDARAQQVESSVATSMESQTADLSCRPCSRPARRRVLRALHPNV